MQVDPSLKRVRNQVNSIEINIMSRKNKNSGKLCLQEIDQQRQLAEEIYKKQEELRQKYDKYDSKNFPSYLFCKSDIVEQYGLCNDIFLNFNEVNESNEKACLIEDIENRRKNWLNNTIDKGQLYKDAYHRIHNELNLNSIQSERSNLITQIEQFIELTLDPEQFLLLKESERELLEYKNAAVKSKKRKEKFNAIINNISLLVGHTKLSLHQMLSIKYDLHFIINDIQTNDLTSKIKQTQFNDMIDTWRQLNDSYNQEVKYIKNTKEFSKIKLVDLHMEFEKKGSYISPIVQTGKYYKKWSSLKELEKFDRIDSYAGYFIRKSFTMKEVIKQEREEEFILKVNEVLQNAIKEKSISSNYIKWNIKSGIITTIKGLEYNSENEEFTLTSQPRQRSVRKASQKSIFSNANENIINDVILKCILKDMNGTNTLNVLKDKLKINKISAIDRESFGNRFDEIKSIVKQN